MFPHVTDSLIRSLAKPVPRYTSYPTAPHFHPGVDSATYARWLREVPATTPLSLYVHVPFCDRLCWFCGCHTKQVLRYGPIAAYLPSVYREMDAVADLLDGRGHVTALHVGGGSPSMLRPGDLRELVHRLRRQLVISDALEFSVEVDPNDMTEDRYDALAEVGVTRISIGVQDFNPQVQAAINRIQTFEQTAAVVTAIRQRGVKSINLDVLYGLPFQTDAHLLQTVEQVLTLRPERIALFGYAHVPWVKTHQRMIDEATLPDVLDRYRQAQHAADRIAAAGYVPVGLDHFALPTDALAVAARSGHLHRNFQGYTTDDAQALIGFGASSISSLPQGYVQNITATGVYAKTVDSSGLAAARGVALADDDRMRAWVIEQLMCNFSLAVSGLRQRFSPHLTAAAVEEMQLAALCDGDGLLQFDGQKFRITEKGRPFVRSIAAMFDAYLGNGVARHSAAV